VLLGSNCPKKSNPESGRFLGQQPLLQNTTFPGTQNIHFCLASKEAQVNLNAGKRQLSDSVHQRTFISVFHNFFNCGKLLTSRDFSYFSFSFEVILEFCFLIGKYVISLFLSEVLGGLFS